LFSSTIRSDRSLTSLLSGSLLSRTLLRATYSVSGSREGRRLELRPSLRPPILKKKLSEINSIPLRAFFSSKHKKHFWQPLEGLPSLAPREPSNKMQKKLDNTSSKFFIRRKKKLTHSSWCGFHSFLSSSFMMRCEFSEMLISLRTLLIMWSHYYLVKISESSRRPITILMKP